jgi:hypothetical protein
MARPYTPIRCYAETVARLEAWRDRQVAAVDACRSVQWWAGESPTLSQCIDELRERDDAHRDRARLSKARRKASRATASAVAP